jgi:hypothetical protein
VARRAGTPTRSKFEAPSRREASPQSGPSSRTSPASPTRAASPTVLFGVGTGLTLDEVALLVELQNPYWRSGKASLVQGALAALAAAVLAARFYRRGAELLDEPTAEE